MLIIEKKTQLFCQTVPKIYIYFVLKYDLIEQKTACTKTVQAVNLLNLSENLLSFKE